MKQLILTILFLFVHCLINAQVINGTIYSESEDFPIPYTKIGVQGENIGVVTNENGHFSIDLTNANPAGKIIIEVAGHDIFLEDIKDFVQQNNREIFLTHQAIELQELVITPRVLIDKTWGVKTKTKSVLFVVNPDDGQGISNTETAFRFNTKKPAKINKINLNVANINTDQPVILRYSIYNEKDGFPHKNILEEEITEELTADKIIDGTFALDVSDYNIWVQGKFFVAIHFLNKFTGEVQISASLLRTGYVREFYGDWEKVIIAAPAINIEVKVDKNGKSLDNGEEDSE
ncbi:MAG: carboxypeptidase-like regulatory domain-containing protein [Myroides sp.]|nr:carboxypeptidase-like regulatory domain-containing protein [Myroides sp.]